MKELYQIILQLIQLTVYSLRNILHHCHFYRIDSSLYLWFIKSGQTMAELSFYSSILSSITTPGDKIEIILSCILLIIILPYPLFYKTFLFYQYLPYSLNTYNRSNKKYAYHYGKFAKTKSRNQYQARRKNNLKKIAGAY